MAGVVEIALLLARCNPSGDEAARVRVQLREHIVRLIEPAAEYAVLLPESRVKDIVGATVNGARRILGVHGGDPKATLLLLAKATEHLARFADLRRVPLQSRPAPAARRRRVRTVTDEW
ncbi:hypothetical protein ACN20G_11820 [Streptomyces sp. BI20]|uniref:hypothetical protein n=1 Tax=Streptomyces sp. BI20 TaxID=3403460 RepID=UPI003C764016